MQASAPMLIAAVLFIGGCGTNALRVESAGAISKYATVVSDQTSAVFKDVEARRAKAYVTLIASDTSCEPVQPVLILVPTEAPPPGAISPPLCAQAGQAPPAGYEVAEFDFRPFATESIQPTVEMAGAVAAYGEAMAKIAQDPKFDSTKQLDAILERATNALATAEGLGISGLPQLIELSDAQKSSAGKLIDIVRNLSLEQRQVKDIRRLYADKARAIQSILPELSHQVDLWVTVAGVGADQITTTNLERAYRDQRSTLTLESRTALIAMIRDAQLQPSRTEKSSKEFRNAIGKLSAENDHLGALLTNPSAEDRAKAAQLSEERILSALGQIAKAISAWRAI